MSKCILVVEDSRTQAEQLKAVLEDGGYLTEVAQDGAAGLAAVAARPPDAIISDIVMPGTVDGYELCRQVKAGPHRDVPVLLLTSLSDPTDIIRALECGADNFLRKPYDSGYLLERLRILFTTREIRANDRVHFGMKVMFLGREVTINAEHQQVLDLLISTFEEAVIQNRELRQREEELRLAKAELDRYAGALEQRLKSVLETIPDVLFSVDASLGNLFYISPAARHVFGYTPEEMLTDPQLWRRSIHLDDLPGVLDGLDRAVNTRSSQIFECRMRPRQGDWRWLQLNVAAVPDDVRGGVRLDGVAHDVTERKRAEETLRQEQFLVSTLMENIPDSIYFKDVESRFIRVNHSLARLFGLSESAQAVGRTDFDFFTPEHARAALETEREVIRTGRPVVDMEEMETWPDRPETWVSSTKMPLRDAAGVIVGTFGISRDITERKRAEEALRRSEAEHRGLVEHATLGIYRSTPEGLFLTVNPALSRMLGYGGAEELQRLVTARDLYADPRERDQLLAQFARGDEAQAESQWKGKDGTPVTVRLNVRLVRDSSGQIECFEGLVEDVTEQRSLENQFRQAQRLEAVGRLAGGVAHDFNNVLTAITGYSELLLDEFEPGDRKRQDVQEIHAAAQRAAGLTRQLLAFSRKQVFQTRVLDLNAVVRMLEKMLQRLIGEDVKLEMSLDSALGAVRADPGQLEQVILNLAVNSRDAMPGGGRLTVETANVDLDEAYAREHVAVRPGRYVMLAVSDTGTGMDAETQSHIFEPFFTTKEQGTGTGLGLATVYGIVKQSGGYVWVYSEPGGGATFKIYLPRVEEPVAAQDVVLSERPVAGGRETVLVAEDDASVREIVTEVLTHKGYRVLRAPDGQTALEMARAEPGEIRLLVTDIVMPSMSGRELAEALVAERPGLRVLYMSGYTDDAVVRHGVLEEGLPYLQKPFTPRALAVKVREVLDRSSVAAAF
jgi:PAS domain S-box-containing protein